MKLKEAVRLIVKEAMDSSMYEGFGVLESDRSENLTEILNKLRAACGITVVNVQEPAVPVGEGKEKTILKVKFFLTSPSLRHHLKKMSIISKRIPGVFSFRVPIEKTKRLT